MQRNHGVVGQRDLVAYRAGDRGFGQAEEEVCDDRLVPEDVPVPSLLRSVLRLRFLNLKRLLASLAKQVLVKQVKDCVGALVGVVLAEALKLRGVFSEHPFEEVRLYHRFVLVPNLV